MAAQTVELTNSYSRMTQELVRLPHSTSPPLASRSWLTVLSWILSPSKRLMLLTLPRATWPPS